MPGTDSLFDLLQRKGEAPEEPGDSSSRAVQSEQLLSEREGRLEAYIKY